MTKPALALREVTVVLGGRPIVREASLTARAGSILGIFGPSGSGKTTLFRAIAGESRVTRGSIAIAAHDVTDLPLWSRARLGLGHLPQTPSVLFDLRVRENLALFAAVAEAHAETPLDVHAIAVRLGLGSRLEIHARDLSGGERRRLELTRALATNPRVLLCDEPFSAIDPHGRDAVARLLVEQARERGTAIVVSDHHLAQTLSLCDRARLLLEGELGEPLSAKAFATDDAVRQHYG